MSLTFEGRERRVTLIDITAPASCRIGDGDAVPESARRQRLRQEVAGTVSLRARPDALDNNAI